MPISVGGLTAAQHAAISHTDSMLALFELHRDPRVIVIYGRYYASIGAGTWAWSGLPASYLFGAGFSNDPAAANGDNITYEFYAPEGDYNLYLPYTKHPNGGIVDISIDGTNVIAGLDTYNNPILPNFDASALAVSLSGPNPHSLKFTLNGKNAGSGGYRFYPGALFFLKRVA